MCVCECVCKLYGVYGRQRESKLAKFTVRGASERERLAKRAINV